MGFFSWNCKECGHPALSLYAITSVNCWMNDIIVHNESETVMISGEYDGYGRIETKNGSILDLMPLEPFTLRHIACWEKAGKPGYAGEAKSADDQGYFYDKGDHDMERPK